MRWRATFGPATVASLVFALGACGGSSGGEARPAGPPEQPDPAAAFSGERAEVAEALVSYGEAVESGDVEALCEEVLVEAKSFYERRNDCQADPDNDAVTGDAPAIDEITRIEMLPKDYHSKRIPGQIRNWIAQDALQFLSDAYAVVDAGGSITAFGLDRIDREWRVVSRMDAREEEPPVAPDRRRFLATHGVLGSFGIVSESSDHRCEDSIGSIHVDGTVTDVEAKSARQAILRSELVGEKARKVLEQGGELTLRQVNFETLTRSYELSDGEGGLAAIPVEGNGPVYYVNNFGGCQDNPLARDLLPF